MAIRYEAGANTLFLGRQGENLAREIEFNVNDWIETYGDGTVQALYMRAADTSPYPLNLTVENGKAVWIVTNADTAYVGRGYCELRYSVGDVLVKSKAYTTLVAPSLQGEMANPDALPDWVADVLAAGEAARNIVEAEVVKHIHYIESLDKSNKVYLRDLDSGTYILHGYFSAFSGYSGTFTFSSDMLVAVVKQSSTSYVQIFYPKGNAIQYLEITDEAMTRKDAKLVNMESTANKVSLIDDSSDDSHYPTAKAVYDAIEAAFAARGM